MAIISSQTETQDINYDFTATNSILYATSSGVIISDESIGVESYYFADRVVNSGYIAGGTGVEFDQADGSLVNEAGASIDGLTWGVYVGGDDFAATNNVGANISSGSVGVYLFGNSDSFFNNGQIEANNIGVEFYIRDYGQLVNTGSIAGQTGVTVASAENITITNSGTITGTTTGIESLYYYGNASNDLLITNSGTIFGGIDIQTPLSTIHNSGAINGTIQISGTSAAIRNTGTINDGISISGASSAIQNIGTIAGNVTVSGASGLIHNSGTIHGDVSFGSGTNVFDGLGGSIEGTLTGGTGSDSFELGRQTISGLIDGGGGNDTVSFTTASGAVTVDLAGGTATGPGITDHLANFVNATGSIYGDTLYGTDGNNVLNGGAGADTMSGGLGDDTYYVDNVGDVVVEASNGGNDTVYSSVSYNLNGMFVETLTLTGAANINATGNGQANTINGNAGNNVIDGGAGADTMSGGLGNDTYYVDNVGDKVIEATNGGNDTVYSSVSFSLSGTFVETLALTGTANINATGNGQANTLIGNAGNNVITTGAGADIVSYASAAFGADTITDFTAGTATGHDTLQFASSVFANYAAVMAHSAQVGADVVITYDAHDTIDLQNVTLANLVASDFAFI